MVPASFTRVARLATVFLLLTASLLLAAGPAQAGGPTSALLVSPSTGRTASVYYSDDEYERLSTAMGGYEPTADPTIVNPNLAAPTSPGSASVTVTWLIHDVSVWRIDRIFFTSAEGPLIVTQTSAGGGDLSEGMYPGESGNDTAIWHRPPDPQELRAVLSTLGLFGSDGSPSMAVDDAVAAADVESVATSSPVTVDPADRAGVMWWWVLAGLVAGIVLTAAAVRFVPSVRQQLLRRSDDGGQVRMVEVAG